MGFKIHKMDILIKFKVNLFQDYEKIYKNGKQLIKEYVFLKNEILPFATVWMNLEGIMLSKIYQRKTSI